MLPTKVYDIVKYLTLIAIPAFGSLYMGLGQIWTSLPHPVEVAASTALICTFLGTLVGINSAVRNKSYDGYLAPDGENELTGHTNLKMVVTRPPGDIVKGDVARFKVGEAPPVDVNQP